MGGQRIATYTVTGPLGRGGFGEVLAAVHDVLGRDVAIKVLHAKWCDDGEAVRRFVAEARAVNAVRHPNIVDVVDFGTLEDGRHYHVMERLRGENLAARLAARGVMTLDEALPILRAIAAGLDAAHEANIVHRDVKPENVFLHRAQDGAEVAKLIDFGLAKLITPAAEGPTQTGVILGTPAYMAPEQCRGTTVDERCDVYAFGVIAYELITGAVPHRGADPVATLLAHVHDETVPPSKRRPELPPQIDAVLMPLLAKTAAARPRRLVPVVEQLAAIAGGVALPAMPRRRAWWIAGAAVVMASGVVTAIAITGDDAASSVPPAPPDATPSEVVDAAVAVPLVDAAVAPGAADARASSSTVRADAKRRPSPEDPENPYVP